MTDVERIIELARSQIGVSETPPGSNSVIYNRAYYGSDARLPWCVVFIWWLFDQLGLNSEFCDGVKTAYCPYVVNFARNAGRWISNPAEWKPGDLFLYDWDNDGVSDHIGLCINWGGSSGQTIEGNEGDAVSLVWRSVGNIMGAYRPAYRQGEIAPQPPVEPDAPTPGVDDATTHTVKQGDSLWLIAQLYNTSIAELARLNNIQPPYTIYPNQVLKIREIAEPEPPEETPADDSAETYTVKQGDSLWSIALHTLGNGWRWPKIAEENDIEYPYTIYPGQILKIPKREG